MAGGIIAKDVLNMTLKLIIYVLTKHNFKNWFIAYGTLLGIHRENSCIDGDDDIDIIIDANELQRLRPILLKEGFKMCSNPSVNNRAYFLRIEG